MAKSAAALPAKIASERSRTAEFLARSTSASSSGARNQSRAPPRSQPNALSQNAWVTTWAYRAKPKSGSACTTSPASAGMSGTARQPITPAMTGTTSASTAASGWRKRYLSSFSSSGPVRPGSRHPLPRAEPLAWPPSPPPMASARARR